MTELIKVVVETTKEITAKDVQLTRVVVVKLTAHDVVIGVVMHLRVEGLLLYRIVTTPLDNNGSAFDQYRLEAKTFTELVSKGAAQGLSFYVL